MVVLQPSAFFFPHNQKLSINSITCRTFPFPFSRTSHLRMLTPRVVRSFHQAGRSLAGEHARPPLSGSSSLNCESAKIALANGAVASNTCRGTGPNFSCAHGQESGALFDPRLSSYDARHAQGQKQTREPSEALVGLRETGDSIAPVGTKHGLKSFMKNARRTNTKRLWLQQEGWNHAGPCCWNHAWGLLESCSTHAGELAASVTNGLPLDLLLGRPPVAFGYRVVRED